MFFLHSLLLDHEEHNVALVLQHDALFQSERLRPTLQAHNWQMVGPGQENWSHACDLCCWVHVDPDGIPRELVPTRC
jgi:hypothetical protein